MNEEHRTGGAGLSSAQIEAELVSVHAECAGGLTRYAMVLTGDPERARDAVQESFLKFFTARKHQREVTNPRAWLFRVLRNHVLDQVRSGVLDREIPLDAASGYPDTRHSPEDQYRYGEMDRELRKLLAPRELECLRLRAVGLRYEEIADVLGIRSGTVGVLLSRAHTKIRTSLEKRGEIRYEDKGNAAVAK